jgi:hypothetical protein
MPADVWDQLSDLARRAPSPHNTQPFRLRPRSATEADLVVVSDRLLPVEDRGNRYVLSACGLFVDALERAGDAVGVAVDVELHTHVDPSALTIDTGTVPVGTVRVSPAGPADREAAAPLLLRRTSRLPYDGRPLSDERIEELHAVVASFGHRLHVDSTAGGVDWVLRQNACAIIDNLQIPGDRKEIWHWTRLGPTPEHGDGLWRVPLHQPAWELWLAFHFPWLLTLPGISHWAVRRYLATQTGTRHVALLSGPFGTWPELVTAGRALAALWTAMTVHGISLHPYGSTLTNPWHARRIAERFGVDDGWLLVRFGTSVVPPESPRLVSVVER